MPPRDRTKRRVTPHQERALASHDAILTAAEQLLVEEGFARMTTNRIARRAGVNIALVYRYFSGKEAIVGALVERFAEATRASVMRALTENARAPLPIAVRALLSALTETPSPSPLHRELVENVDVTKRRALVHAVSEEVSKVFADFLERRTNELRPLPDRAATMFVLEHAIEAATHAAAFYRPDGLSTERALDALAELIVRALARVEDHPAART
jgi:AcrR family transcriptional regulator